MRCFIAFVLIFLGGICEHSAFASVMYTSTVLQPLPGDSTVNLNAIDNNGNVYGDSGFVHAVMWPAGSTIPHVVDINSLSVTDKASNGDLLLHRFPHSVVLSPGGTITDPGVLSGGNYTIGNSLNANVYMTGSSEKKGSPSHAFIWHMGGSIIDITPNSPYQTEGKYINVHNEVVGYDTPFDINTISHAFMYNDGSLTILPGRNGIPQGINDNGVIIGRYDIDANRNSHAAVWINDSLIDISNSSGITAIDATAINNNGTIIGNYGNGDLFIYDKGGMSDLTSMIISDHRIQGISRINDEGQMIGRTSEGEGVLISAIPEPTAASLLSVVLGAGLLHRRRK